MAASGVSTYGGGTQNKTVYFYDWGDQEWKEWGIGNGTICGGNTRNGDGTCTYNSSDPNVDGTIYDSNNNDNCEASPSTVGNSKTNARTDAGLQDTTSGDDCYMAYYEYPTSSIPDGSVITDLSVCGPCCFGTAEALDPSYWESSL